MTSSEARMIAPLQLAYLGDAVCSLYIRDHLLSHTTLTARKLHLATVSMVNAKAQAAVLKNLCLSDDEQDIVRRGKGAASHPPKNCDRDDYRLATAYEALLGYLYLTGQIGRIAAIIQVSLDSWAAKNNKEVHNA